MVLPLSDAAPAGGAARARVLFVSEGDAETHDSWSGVSRSVVTHLRDADHEVRVADADLYGAARLRVALRTLALPRKRWWVRYHLHASAFRARSEAARRAAAGAGDGADVVLQVGATFAPPRDDLPLALYCDSNVEMSRLGAATGQSEGAMLTAGELAAVRERELRIYRQAAVIFTMSERVRRSFIEDFGIPPERLITVHCGPNVAVPAAPAGVTRAAEPTILFVGRDFARKGGPLLLESFALVRRRLPDARLRIVGGRPPGGGAAAPGVEYLGFLGRDSTAGGRAMDAAYRGASVFCIPTRFEPFGTSFVEAMMYGLPCVGPSMWAVPEIIEHGRTGLLVPPGDPEALAEALLQVLTAPELAARMGAAGRIRAEEHFSWTGVTRKMSRALDAVARGALPSEVRDRGQLELEVESRADAGGGLEA